MQSCLEISDLVVKFNHQVAVEIPELRIEPGVVTALLGPNGAGKSSMISTLATLGAVATGVLTHKGLDVASNLRKYRRSLGWLPQDNEYPLSTTVFQYVQYVAWLKEVPAASRRQRVMEALEKVGLAGRSESCIGELSGGMRRRVGLAQALVNRPSVLLLDEPTAGVDPLLRQKLCSTISELATGSVVVAATHKIEDVVDWSGDVVVLDAGVIRYSGSVAEMGSPAVSGRVDVESVQRGYFELLDRV